ncbi:MAG: pyruvate kinase [Candidatus Kaiserbacteria bacterium]|nr:pyruvate kinase [Candidatus Kaiserbacteria bacterium]
MEIPKTTHLGKIVATLGPASESKERIAALVEAGADVFRLNFSHDPHPEQGQRIAHVRECEQEIGKSIGIIADLQGPKLRTGSFAGDEEDAGVVLEAESPFVFHLNEYPGDERGVSLMHPEIFQAAEVGMAILVNDGRLQFQVTAVTPETLETTVVTGGRLKRKKGVNIPRLSLPIAAITEKDKKDMQFALSQGVDWVALSFVQRPEDVRQAREMVGDSAGIISKIEKPSAVEHIEEIIEESDAIMVARGDLGVEIPPEEVPYVQKRIIKLCRQAGKPMIVATHMLDSMIDSPFPTRAEVSDVANAVYDGSDAVMLSAETTIGDYPAESVAMMRRIVRRVVTDSEFFTAEKQIDFAAFHCAATPAVAAVQKVVQDQKPAVVVAVVSSFDSAVCYARERHRCPLVAVTADQQLARRLALVWGVLPLYVQDIASVQGDQQALTSLVRAVGIDDTAVRVAVLA